MSKLNIYVNSKNRKSDETPSNFLEKGFIELELECITTSQNIDFITGQTLQFFYSLIIVDEEPEVTKDLTLAPPIDYNNYNINIPIRPY